LPHQNACPLCPGESEGGGRYSGGQEYIVANMSPCQFSALQGKSPVMEVICKQKSIASCNESILRIPPLGPSSCQQGCHLRACLQCGNTITQCVASKMIVPGSLLCQEQFVALNDGNERAGMEGKSVRREGGLSAALHCGKHVVGVEVQYNLMHASQFAWLHPDTCEQSGC